MNTPIERVAATAAALELTQALQRQHGDVLFYLSHGCCDGSTPMCLTTAELTPGVADVRWGTVGGAPFWLSQTQAEFLANPHLTLDVDAGNNGAFSLEDGSGQRFVMRMRLLSDEEAAACARP